MLQLPQAENKVKLVHIGKFTKAQIAEIARGGEVKTRRTRKSKRDPIVGHVERFKLHLERRAPIKEALDAIEALLDRQGALMPRLYIGEAEDRYILTSTEGFTHENQIKREVRETRKCFRKRIQDLQKIIKSPGPLYTEHKQALENFRRHLAALPALEAKLLRAMKAEVRRVNALQRREHYAPTLESYLHEHGKMWSAFDRARQAEIVTIEGALALIELATAILATGVIYSRSTIDLLTKAHKFLSESRQ
jgi:hypothetical protein